MLSSYRERTAEAITVNPDLQLGLDMTDWHYRNLRLIDDPPESRYGALGKEQKPGYSTSLAPIALYILDTRMPVASV